MPLNRMWKEEKVTKETKKERKMNGLSFEENPFSSPTLYLHQSVISTNVLYAAVIEYNWCPTIVKQCSMSQYPLF